MGNELLMLYSPLNVPSKYRWNPDEMTLQPIIKKTDRAYTVFRRSSTGYVNKKFLRDLILSKAEHMCQKCDSTRELQIDHIKSVRYCFDNNLFTYCNSIKNLQVLCSMCNIKKGS